MSGTELATSTASHSVLLYDMEKRAEVLTLPPEESEIWCCAWSRDGTRLAVSLADGGVVVWNMEAVRDALREFGLDPSAFRRAGDDIPDLTPQLAVVEGRATRPARREQGIPGHVAHAHPAQPLVEPSGVAAGDRVEHE